MSRIPSGTMFEMQRQPVPTWGAAGGCDFLLCANENRVYYHFAVGPVVAVFDYWRGKCLCYQAVGVF